MTVPEFKRGFRDWLVPSVVGLLVVAQIVFFFLLIPLLEKQADASRAGREARVRQCETKPIARRVYSWLETQGVITRTELELFLAGAPSDAVCREILSN